MARGGFEQGRSGKRIDFIILYTTEHQADRAIKLWRESESLSGHYMVMLDGVVWQFLKDSDTGWHAGNRDYNLRSIAVAVEGFADPANPENLTKRDPLQNEAQLESLAQLLKWLCERYEIPVDRAHIIGKNQVPGVSTDTFPKGGPQFWGGASNKSSPGGRWNWARLMERLGRKPDYQSLIALTNCPVITLPEANAPLITTLAAGETVQAYDNHDGYWLVLVTGNSMAQPYLESGKHHWDGWVQQRLVQAVPIANAVENAH
ncbi:MAG TPA: N-acetylmuramoyl-L-alanine amidase [Verrucomicrobiae bacterium]|nr:N-acetylmuramoyl-L-alanine amidase [Verrucomicrobiae bacterium]